MNKTYTAKETITISAPPAKVWEALTTPKLIKQYFLGTDVISDWKVGSPIIFKGEWQGKSYEDKGTILNFEPEKLMVYTHWSPLSGVPDVPENHHTVTYSLSPRNGGTEVILTQDNAASEQEKIESEKIWNMMLVALKKLLEG